MNVNEASREELEKLPGVGGATAEKIVKARPVGGLDELEALIPPSAWLKIGEEGVLFAFGDAARDDPKDVEKGPEEPRGDVSPVEVPGTPVMRVLGPEPVVLKRLIGLEGRPETGLKAGADYLCIWNMRIGPQNEAWVPEDAPAQQEVEEWFTKAGMTIKFAHYGPSIQLGIPNRGLVNLVLFEIIKEEEGGENDGRNGQGNEEGN